MIQICIIYFPRGQWRHFKCCQPSKKLFDHPVSKSYIFIHNAFFKWIIFNYFFSSSKSVVSYSGSDVFIFSNQIRTFYEGSKLSQMKQDIAKSRVKYGGTRFKGILPSDKTKIRKYFILSQISWVNILKLIFLHNLKFLSSRKGDKG